MDAEMETLLHLNLSLAATPTLTVLKAYGMKQVAFAIPEAGNGFAIKVEAALPFTALTEALNALLHGKRLELTEGFVNRHVVIESCKVNSAGQHLVVEVQFSGSFTGTVFLTGVPFYNPDSRQVELQHIAYDLKTTNLILKGAKWLFGNLIREEVKKYVSIDVSRFYETLSTRINELLNKAWATGITASGQMDALTITGVYAQAQQLLVQGYCSGQLQLAVSEQALKF
jgi:hypothetical protein